MSARPGDPSVSVVVPCRNEASTLEACLDALRRQDLPRDGFEVLVVDGGSEDGSRAIARRDGVRLLSDGGGGPGAARNVGILAARAPLVAFTDADCLPATDWLARHAEIFAEDPSVAGVAGAVRMSRATLLGRLEDVNARASYRGFITSNVAYRRDALLEVGGFAEDLRCAEDYDLAWRMMDAGLRVVHDPRPVVVHDPPELRGPLAAYLRKQAWYARHDVPAYARAALRAARDPNAAGSRGAFLDMACALRESACVVALAGGALARRPLLAGLGVSAAAGLAWRRARRNVRAQGEDPRLVARLAALETAKGLTRGAGTLLGVLDLARPARRGLPLRRTAAAPGPASPEPWAAPSRTRRASHA